MSQGGEPPRMPVFSRIGNIRFLQCKLGCHPCLSVQDYMYEVLDQDTMPGGRSIWIIDMKGEHYLIA